MVRWRMFAKKNEFMYNEKTGKVGKRTKRRFESLVWYFIFPGMTSPNKHHKHYKKIRKQVIELMEKG